MSVSSLPSKKTVLVDIPKVENFAGEFYYGFFTKDERVVGTSSLSNPPRYIWLSWKPNVIGNNQNLMDKISVKNNERKILDEQKFTGKNFSGFYFQDTGLDGKLSLYVKKGIEILSPTSGSSALDSARILNDQTSDQINLGFLVDSIANTQSVNYPSKTPNVLDVLKTVGVSVQINNKIAGKMLTALTEDPTTPFTDEVLGILDNVKQIEKQAQTTHSSQFLSSDDYDFELTDYITIKKTSAQNFTPTLQTVGYKLDKWELDDVTPPVKMGSLFVENPKLSNLTDTDVKYGKTYLYTISQIVYLETQVQDTAGEQMLAVGILISSLPGNTISIVCKENIPPPPPADFSISWDYNNKSVCLMWSLPTTTQRDVKKIQIFKRFSIHEPFELIKMYDFDDSVVKTTFNEKPDQELVEMMVNPKMFFFDREFTKDSKCIYALCAIDAHGISSNYSMQIEVSFDKFANKLTKTLVSLSGAPKAYPNVFLRNDAFVDSIKDQGHKNLKIYFDPEFLKVLDAQGNDLGLLKTGVQDEYLLQILNVDLQKQHILSIKLDDRSN